MQVLDILIIVVMAVLFFAALRFTVRSRRSGKCCGGCTGCSGCSAANSCKKNGVRP